ncbi:hypothetical protein IC575_027908 [Cucumis melo]
MILQVFSYFSISIEMMLILSRLSSLCSVVFLNVNEGRYNPEMLPVISQEKWRKGSQWITLVRRHAEVVVNDEIIFPLFKKFCKRWPPADHDTRRKTTVSHFG